MNLSIIILTHNSNNTLESAIKSSLFADEIIIVDDYSTDDTINLAKKYPARVISHQLNQNFAAQRNFALNQAKSDWILFLDSDETIPAKLQKEIISTLKSNPSQNGFYLKRTDFFLRRPLKHGETGNIKLLRLARRHAGKWHRPVHEVWKIKPPLGNLKNPLTHHPHPNLEAFFSSINHYTTIEASHRSTPYPLIFIQAIIFPLAKFLYNYFFRLGFLDGIPGFINAYFMSLHSLIVRVKLYEQNHH